MKAIKSLIPLACLRLYLEIRTIPAKRKTAIRRSRGHNTPRFGHVYLL